MKPEFINTSENILDGSYFYVKIPIEKMRCNVWFNFESIDEDTNLKKYYVIFHFLGIKISKEEQKRILIESNISTRDIHEHHDMYLSGCFLIKYDNEYWGLIRSCRKCFYRYLGRFEEESEEEFEKRGCKTPNCNNNISFKLKWFQHPIQKLNFDFTEKTK